METPQPISRPAGGRFDALVVGAGLAGLAAGLELQRSGRSVLVLEKRSAPGGLCGTLHLDGYEFVIACNDFGIGLRRILHDLGVPVHFLERRTRFHLGDTVLHLPPRASDVPKLLGALPGLTRLAWRARGARPETLASLAAAGNTSPALADWISSLAYPLGAPPSRVRIEALRAEASREYGYGYHRPVVPAGGPGRLVEAMVERFEALGGRLALETESLRIEPEPEGHAVVTPRGRLHASHVISSQDRWQEFPEECEAGLAASALLLAVRRDLPYPRGVHTMVYLPPGISEWMTRLDAGRQPEAFGCHLFRSDLPERPDHYTLNVFFYLPRGVEELSADAVERVVGTVLAAAERMLPGLGRALLYKRFVSPKAFFELHGLSSQVVARIVTPGFHKPDRHDPRTGVHHVGDSVQPPGEHAGGAVLSGVLAGRAVHRALAARGAEGP